MAWHIEGDYFESCNCEAICPCRTVGGVPGGRSTYGICMGVLSWLVHEGHADGVDLGGLAAALVIRYEDDEPGSPWSFVVHVDERGTEEQREELAVRASPIELRVDGDRKELRVGSAVELAATKPFPTEERVSCVIPGHHIAGTEYYAERLAVHDEPFDWELEGSCAFVSTFSYSG